MKLKHGHPSNRISICRSLHSTWILDCLILELRIWHGLAGFPAAFRLRVIRVQGLWLFPGQAIAPEPCLFFCCIMVVVVLFKTSNGCWVFTHLDNV
ncbi:hypothetical protein HanXRQr2_Chr09g0398071 [Helianthus annuus]|uniref:Uncharacterized protein n=1 Tax=Helianthus annuus TaxID=4232 RepID=A0A251TX86_HELAN|nr:hypothetical protein HanXRQr2_Chr09g0398071 [Helianthus annuus]KAJ0893973.1 hypothetical protein HanPSC8_Chr09g0383831 [Helianthus annuus]